MNISLFRHHSLKRCVGYCVKGMHSWANTIMLPLRPTVSFLYLLLPCPVLISLFHALSISIPFCLISLPSTTQLLNCTLYQHCSGCWRHKSEDFQPCPSQFPLQLSSPSLSIPAKLNLAVRIPARLRQTLPGQCSGLLLFCFLLAPVINYHDGLYVFIM